MGLAEEEGGGELGRGWRRRVLMTRREQGATLSNAAEDWFEAGRLR